MGGRGCTAGGGVAVTYFAKDLPRWARFRPRKVRVQFGPPTASQARMNELIAATFNMGIARLAECVAKPLTIERVALRGWR